MPTYVAFLRAINLGSTRKFPKDAIKVATEAAGGRDVETYINTGNVRLTHSARSVAKVQAALEKSYAAEAGFEVSTGDVGENITTRGVDLLGSPRGTLLRLGPEAVVEVTGLRNPCVQLDRFAAGLMRATLDRDADGRLVRKAGVMGVVVVGGEVRIGDAVSVELPPTPHLPLEPV